jgi:hypothetical protein
VATLGPVFRPLAERASSKSAKARTGVLQVSDRESRALRLHALSAIGISKQDFDCAPEYARMDRCFSDAVTWRGVD